MKLYQPAVRAIATTLLLVFAVVASAHAQQATVPRVMVILPERIDVDWYWYYYTVETQHRVQTKVEQALLEAGYELVDLETRRGLRCHL